MPYLRNVIPKTPPPPARGQQRAVNSYRNTGPTIKQAVAERLYAVEAAARIPEAVASRCCGKCKTPYNCGNKGCPCHSADLVRTLMDN